MSSTRLLAVVAADLPAHERRVERGGLLVVDAMIVEVVEPDRLPAGRLERRDERHGVARGATLREERGWKRRRSRRCQSEQQIAACDPAFHELLDDIALRVRH